MRRLLLFARRPRPGKVKTRLSPPLSAVQALDLYRAFLDDTLALVRPFSKDGPVELWWDGEPSGDDLAGVDAGDFCVRVQAGRDLGERLTSALGERDLPAVVIGSDSPTLPASAIERAFSSLAAETPIAMMRSSDGGFVLLGLWRPTDRIFRDVPWGGPEVAGVILDRAIECGLTVTELPIGYDVDDASGLQRLKAELRDPAVAARAPATARALRLLF